MTPRRTKRKPSVGVTCSNIRRGCACCWVWQYAGGNQHKCVTFITNKFWMFGQVYANADNRLITQDFF